MGWVSTSGRAVRHPDLVGEIPQPPVDLCYGPAHSADFAPKSPATRTSQALPSAGRVGRSGRSSAGRMTSTTGPGCSGTEARRTPRRFGRDHDPAKGRREMPLGSRSWARSSAIGAYGTSVGRIDQSGVKNSAGVDHKEKLAATRATIRRSSRRPEGLESSQAIPSQGPPGHLHI
jgi:hypothetical protein